MEIQISELANNGDGVGRDATGRVVFVPGTAPGDRVRVRISDETARFLRAELVEVLEASGERTEPRCKFFGRCGGCDWQHISYAAQCAAKLKQVRDAIERLGKISLPLPIGFTASPQEYGYRARTRLISGPDGLGYRIRGSKQICIVTECPILFSTLENVLRTGLENGSRHRSSDRAKRASREVELACGTSGEVRVVDLDAKKVLCGPERIALALQEKKIEISAGGFFQGNALLWSELLNIVTDAVGAGERVIELFAGAGFFTLALAEEFAAVIAVESEAQAIADLHRNLRNSGLVNVTPIASSVEALSDFAAIQRFAPEVVLLDPPRTGLSPRARKQVLALEASRLVYLSCDPASLARDLADFAAHGYALERVHTFDLFPQTAHVETLAVLQRADYNTQMRSSKAQRSS